MTSPLWSMHGRNGSKHLLNYSLKIICRFEIQSNVRTSLINIRSTLQYPLISPLIGRNFQFDFLNHSHYGVAAKMSQFFPCECPCESMVITTKLLWSKWKIIKLIKKREKKKKNTESTKWEERTFGNIRFREYVSRAQWFTHWIGRFLIHTNSKQFSSIGTKWIVHNFLCKLN